MRARALRVTIRVAIRVTSLSISDGVLILIIMLRVSSTSNTGLARRPKRLVSEGILITDLEGPEESIESARDFRVYSLSISLSVI